MDVLGIIICLIVGAVAIVESDSCLAQLVGLLILCAIATIVFG